MSVTVLWKNIHPLATNNLASYIELLFDYNKYLFLLSVFMSNHTFTFMAKAIDFQRNFVSNAYYIPVKFHNTLRVTLKVKSA